MKCHTTTGISFELTNGMNVSGNDFAPSRNHVERYRIIYGSRWNGPVRELKSFQYQLNIPFFWHFFSLSFLFSNLLFLNSHKFKI